MSKPTAYRITSRDMEEDCPTCGAPLYLGDRAWQLDEATVGFCSPWCARDEAARLANLPGGPGNNPDTRIDGTLIA